MNVGPGGFGHAPVSKGLVLVSVGSSIIANAARASHRRLPQPLVLLSRSLAFRSPGELLFGCFLLYYFRVLERQLGSRQYGSYAAVVTGLSCALQLGATGLLQWKAPLAPAPLQLVLASFVPFLTNIPPTSFFSVLGYKMSDKSFVYLAGLQLLLSSGRQSWLALAASTVAGVLYKANFCNIKRIRLPHPILNVISKFFGPLLVDPGSSGPSISLTSAAPAAGATRANSAGGGFGEGFYDGAGGRGRGGAAGGMQQRHAGGRAAGAAGGGVLPAASPEALQELLSMGFSREQAVQALQQAGNDLQTAISLLVG
ncbi:hypothetical protein COO60DRAFT_1697105 [Scenedesmus sp. NREL 46B-D3]|nr:hypothetical protein COO60DRAFT_1697105 [Scenedesmus sp. NREL 46B-D3]